MRTTLLALSLACALGAPLAHAADAQRPEVGQQAGRLQPKVLAWRRDLHEHPELGNRETRTSKIVADHLRSLGLDVKTGIATTGVIAVLKGGKPGPRIAIRADMDALPVTERNALPFASKATSTFRGETVGVMHACGHDAHTSTLMGVAEALVAMIPEDATIVAYFACFERGVLRELASQFPDLAERLMAMANRTEDLLPVARACWYHRDQRGSWSIKAVLPTIAALDYEALEVKHGGMAQDAWIEAADPSTDPIRKWALEEGLKAYCQQDTWAMILLARQFSGQGSN